MSEKKKLEISREQCLRLAKLEGDSEVGAGALARDPSFDEGDEEFFKRLAESGIRRGAGY